MSEDLRNVESHFAFGQNWAEYAELIGEAQVKEAIAGVRRLLGDSLQGRRFLDIGSGSGIHSLAAVRLCAAEVVAVDVDARSVATTLSVLRKFAGGTPWRVERRSVFDLDPADLGEFDIVYSWGVLHHTGDMKTAVRRAAAMLAKDGMFAFALYRCTRLCGFWTWEKRWYTRASAFGQRVARFLYSAWLRLVLGGVAARRWALGRASSAPMSLREYVSNYTVFRGMDFRRDVHDWLGGFPYESTLPDEVDALMSGCGLRHVASHLCVSDRKRTHGLLGSGCDEYVYTK
jgi:2-polyprenyl-6-hydroxyphenyl methylase/3-demethylubiquinone-9 3-methyltransferase